MFALIPVPAIVLRFGVLLILLSVSVAAAQAQAEQNNASRDVRIVLDISGSMVTADPDNLRLPASRMLVQMLPEQSRAGIWTFGQYVNMLVPHGTVDAQWKAGALQRLDSVQAVARHRNLGEALRRATWDRDFLPTRGEDGRFAAWPVRDVVLLTDGGVHVAEDPHVNATVRTNIQERLILELAEKGYRIHTIALSENADVPLLRRLSLLTGGQHVLVDDAAQLLPVFAQVVDQAAPQPRIPLENDGDQDSFVIPPGITEFSLLSFRDHVMLRTQLTSPGGQVINSKTVSADVRWYRDTRYDLVTVQRPVAGRWLLKGRGISGSRITVVGDLRLASSGLPASVHPGFDRPLRIWLEDVHGPVTESSLLEMIEIQAQLRDRDGLIQPLAVRPAQNGTFVVEMDGLLHEGHYSLQVEAITPTFHQRLESSLRVFNPVSITLLPRGSEAVELLMDVSQVSLSPASLIAAARVRRPDGETQVLTAQRGAQGRWRIRVEKSAGPGKYDVQLGIRGHRAVDGEAVTLTPSPIHITLPYEGPVVSWGFDESGLPIVPAGDGVIADGISADTSEDLSRDEAQLKGGSEVDQATNAALVAPATRLVEVIKPTALERFLDQAVYSVLILLVSNLVLLGAAVLWLMRSGRRVMDLETGLESLMLELAEMLVPAETQEFVSDPSVFDDEVAPGELPETA